MTKLAITKTNSETRIDFALIDIIQLRSWVANVKGIAPYPYRPRSCVCFRVFLIADAAKRPGLVSQARPLLIDLGCPVASTLKACATDSTQVGSALLELVDDQ